MHESIEQDTPINRATIAEIEVDQLDVLLEQLRERRLVRVKALEAIAQTKADEHSLSTYMKFQKLLARTKEQFAKQEEVERKLQENINKLRVMQIEVGG